MTQNSTLANDKRRALLVHINGMERVTPLAGGYLKAYANKEPEIQQAWEIVLYSTFVDNTAASKLIMDIQASAADVVGFSVYVWNAGLVRRILPPLRRLMSDAVFILGGVEVINRADKILEPSWENVLVCNGEGEKSFRDLLRLRMGVSTVGVEQAAQAPLGSVPLPILAGNDLQKAEAGDASPFQKIGGISFYSNGILRTTPAYPRITSLDEIPSPYLEGYFDRRDFSVALLETNRGCPYKCEFCFWGGAVGQKIHRLSSSRVAAEIQLIGRDKARAVYICDANFGIFPEDVALAREFVRVRQTTGFPRFVRYSSAKNNPDRAVEIATVLVEGQVLSVQPLSLQSLNERALELAKRENIPLDTYYRLQTRTNELCIASFIELIWPMPGETLASFKDGIDRLCRMGAQAFSVYPLLWLNNVGYTEHQEALGVVTLDCGDSNSTARTVIQTAEVTFAEWVDGLMFTNAVQLLHGCRGLYQTMKLLDRLGITGWQGVFDRFKQWMDEASCGELQRVWRLGRQKVDEIYSTLSWPGHLIEAALVTMRYDFDSLLKHFVRENPDLFGGDHAELISAAFELDLLARPFVYANTPLSVVEGLEVLRVCETRQRGWLVESPFAFGSMLPSDGESAPCWRKERTLIYIEHERGQVYRMPRRIQKEYWDECRMFAIEMGNHYPTWGLGSGPIKRDGHGTRGEYTSGSAYVAAGTGTDTRVRTREPVDL